MAELDALGIERLHELRRRLDRVREAHGSLAQLVGHLYLWAGDASAPSICRRLNKPMRQIADSQRAFASLRDELNAVVECSPNRRSKP